MSFEDQLHDADLVHLLESRNSAGETSLHVAAISGNVEHTQFLVDAGADVNAQDNTGKTPIMLVIEHKPLELLQIVEILCEAGADIHVSDVDDKSSAQLVLGNSSISGRLHKLFLDIIHRECKYQSKRTAEELIKLHCPLWKAAILKNAEVIKHMIVHGCPVDSRHPDKKFTALSVAVEFMDLETVKVLIERGADADLKDYMGFLPISKYGSYTPGEIQQPEIMKILLDKTLLLKDLSPKRLIIQFHGAFQSGNKEIIQMLLEYHNNILNMRDVQGQTPLHYLSGNYHSDITEVLQGRKIDVNVCDAGGRTPLFAATEYYYSHINTFRFLLENGADVNAKSDFIGKGVPLFALCQRSSIKKNTYFEIIELFLQYEVDIQFVSSDQTTVFDIIIENEKYYMAGPLLAYLAILDESKKPITELIRNTINCHPIFRVNFDICKGELIKMKNNVINNKFTLYKILVDQVSDEAIVKSIRFCPDSISNFEKLKKQFELNNHYYAQVQRRISSVLSKLELLQKAALVVCKLSKLRLDVNHLVITEIINYLDFKDLKTLIKVEI